ncbi:chemotaxis protein CheB [Pelomonas sp. APW6]|uniref:Chemotaxis protein CheB n=1 Tax=Roseateles subflavus TaxID=3053353 RepID=A0ABT7LDV3_9BURK|nr:chemotaxis protein CheB [Pelomonas sp. APW6]MDL5030639.1 chemotaxis protein CheB [Pelomonas sp. APW6]
MTLPPDPSPPSSPPASDAAQAIVVAVGASAGGLDALRALFSALVVDERMSFVVVTHLPLQHTSYLAELLRRAGPLPAQEVRDGDVLRGGHIHVMPPGRWMGVQGGVLTLEDRPVDKAASFRPIDHFMAALAQDVGPRAVGIVLSGTDHDGTAGLKAIKANGGWTLAQTPATAEFPGMPQSAIDAGAVDEVMTPPGMAQALATFLQHQPQVPELLAAPDDGGAAQVPALMQEVLALVLQRTGHDFQLYRQGMLGRRLRRRMVQTRCEHLSEYLQLLRDSPEETADLASEFLIGVTSFFRDGEAWDALAEVALPALLEGRRADDPPLRVWTPGCSSGEESYSIAMLLIEALEQRGLPAAVQVFGTDLDLDALAAARRGVYPASIDATVSPARLARFFDRRENSYVVSKPLRESVMFAPQNLMRDTPFSRLDLLLCRNVLMYLEQSLQDRIVQLFHFALRPGGFLWFGKAESLTGHGSLFEPEPRLPRLYRRLPGRSHLPRGFVASRNTVPESMRRESEQPLAAAEVLRQHLAGGEACAAVLVDREGRALFYQGDTGSFLAPQGDATQELLRNVRQELRPAMRLLMRQVCADGVATSRRIALRDGAATRLVVMHAQAVQGKAGHGAFVVTFTIPDRTPDLPLPSDLHAIDVAGEIEESRRELSQALEDAERSNEELRLASEEASSLNEELQSSAEELESSKEELQSLNEELSTVNAQLEERMIEVARNADDLANLLESTALAAILLDREMRIRRFTPAVTRLFSLRPGDEGRLLSDMASRVDDPQFVQEALRTFTTRQTVDAEVRGPEGRLYLRRLQPFLTQAGEVDGVVATFTDITVIRKAAQQVRQLTSVLDHSNDAVITLDRQGAILNWNKGAERLYGHPAAHACTLTVFDLAPPECHEQSRQLMTQAWEDGAAGPADTLRQARGGQGVCVSVVMSALRDDQGEVSALLSTERDITERRRIETEVRFRRLADDIPVLLRVEDRFGRAQFVNRACTEFTGATPQMLLGSGWLEYVHPQDRQRYLSAQTQAYAAQARLEIDIRLSRPDGAPRWTRSISVPYAGGDGEFAGYVALMLDIEDRKLAERELLDADRRKDDFLAMLAHELRNPLAPIRHAAQLLACEDVAPETSAWAVGVIERQTEAMRRLLDSLLDVARIARGKTELALAPVELSVVIARSLEVSQASIGARNQTLQVALPDEPLLLNGDLVRLTQVFANLLNNASKYTDEGGTIRVAAHADDGHVEVQVSDTGVGISADMLPHVFDLFSQADRTLDRSKGGLGLGLTLVRQLVELHHGEVRASSPGLGRGSTFTVRLPLLASRAPAAALVPEPVPTARETSCRRVLVVDDNIDAAEMLGAILRLHGHQVWLAHDGPRALELAERQILDVVILDVGLPGQDGYQVARTLRGRAAMAGVTLLMLTGYGQEEDRARALSAGCDRHFVKPVDADVLLKCVAQAPLRSL